MREFKRLDLEDIGSYREIAYNSYPIFKDYSKEGIKIYEESVKKSMLYDDKVEFYGAFDDEKMKGVFRLFLFEMNYFNKMIDVGGLGYMGVDPLYKKEKLALAMVEFYEKELLKRGRALSLLLAFEPSFYKSMGYGFASKMNQYRLKTSSLKPYQGLSDLRYVGPDSLDDILICHRRFVENNHGMLMKIYDEIEELKNREDLYILASYDEKEEVEAYMVYEFLNNKPDNQFIGQINLRELKFLNPRGLAKLMGFLSRQKDQVQTVIISTKIPNFHFLLDSPLNDSNNYVPYGNRETNTQSLGLMYKVLDLGLAFETTRHRKYDGLNLNLKFTIIDDFDSSKKSHKLCFKDGYYQGSTDEYDLELKLKLSDFSSLFLAVISPRELYQLGLLEISQPKYLDLIDRAFGSGVPPLCNLDF